MKISIIFNYWSNQEVTYIAIRYNIHQPLMGLKLFLFLFLPFFLNSWCFKSKFIDNPDPDLDEVIVVHDSSRFHSF